MSDSELVLDGRFRVFSDGSINKILPSGCETPAPLSYASRGNKYAAVNYWVDGKQKRISKPQKKKRFGPIVCFLV